MQPLLLNFNHLCNVHVMSNWFNLIESWKIMQCCCLWLDIVDVLVLLPLGLSFLITSYNRPKMAWLYNAECAVYVTDKNGS